MSITGDQELIELEELRAEQAGQCDDPMGHNETIAYWNGFPPDCSIIHPESYNLAHQASELGPDQKTPLEEITEHFEEKYGPQNSLGLTAKFQEQQIADLVLEPSPEFTLDIGRPT